MCQMLQEVYCVLMDPQSIIDRVKMLTEEIAKIREANKEYASAALIPSRKYRLMISGARGWSRF